MKGFYVFPKKRVVVGEEVSILYRLAGCDKKVSHVSLFCCVFLSKIEHKNITMNHLPFLADIFMDICVLFVKREKKYVTIVYFLL